jgi:IclR family acetate operon transcriptional repressor
MSDDLLRQYVDALDPIRLASGKPLNRKELLARSQEVRRRGYAIGVDERFHGVSSVAAPVIHKARGVVAAINIAGPSSRMPVDALERLSLEVRNAAREISEKLDQL